MKCSLGRPAKKFTMPSPVRKGFLPGGHPGQAQKPRLEHYQAKKLLLHWILFRKHSLLMQDKTRSYNLKGIKYGMWTIGVYALLFLFMLEVRPSLQRILHSENGSVTMIWYIILKLLPFVVTFIFLVTGYSALKGDKSQIFPSIVHGIVLVALWANLFQAFVVFGF